MNSTWKAGLSNLTAQALIWNKSTAAATFLPYVCFYSIKKQSSEKDIVYMDL